MWWAEASLIGSNLLAWSGRPAPWHHQTLNLLVINLSTAKFFPPRLELLQKKHPPFFSSCQGSNVFVVLQRPHVLYSLIRYCAPLHSQQPDCRGITVPGDTLLYPRRQHLCYSASGQGSIQLGVEAIVPYFGTANSQQEHTAKTTAYAPQRYSTT